jgi:hypothetical protein
MATIPNSKALTESDGTTDVFNINTAVSPARVEIPNGAVIQFYSDNYATAGVKITGTGTAPVVSSTAPALASSGTIATAGVGVTRVTPAAAVTGVIMQAGTVNGQSCIVINEGAAASTISMASAGTSNVADGANCVIDGLQEKRFTWDTATSLWYASTDTNNGALNSIQSATAPVITNGNTITTSGVGVARIAPGGAVTGIILQAGTVAGQEVTIINESASANSATMAASGTSNVANGTADVVAGVTAHRYIWDSATSLWYPVK